MVLPGCDEAATIAQAERIRASVHDPPLDFPDQPLRLSASFGATCLTGGLDTNGLTQERLIAVADEALYRAKGAGRNRVVFASADEARSSRIEVEALG